MKELSTHHVALYLAFRTIHLGFGYNLSLLQTAAPMNRIRPLTQDDVPKVKKVIDKCGLFPSEMLDEMTEPYFLLTTNSGGRSADHHHEEPISQVVLDTLGESCWFVSSSSARRNANKNNLDDDVEEEELINGVVYCAPEKLTEGTFNALLLAVDTDFHRQGIGSKLMKHLEEYLQLNGARLLLVETAGSDEYTQARNFYDKSGFEQVARIADYYQDGEDKIVFWKKLNK